ncbi:MAG: Hydroxyacylglutathione hydrolase GloB [Myxococcota bacterium]|nr:Hydroxyacylglutathione hydrolase GloB [Myxococcota bacterium]
MSLEVIQFPVLEDNYTYLIIDSLTRESAVVDCPDAEPIFAEFRRKGWKLVGIWNTHHHPDHVAANQEIYDEFDVEVLGGAYDMERQRIPCQTRVVREGDRCKLGRIEARVLEVPGHTLGHIAYLFDGALFCGDTLFAGGCGRLFEGSPRQMFDSLQKLAALPPETKIHCAHEYTEANLRFALTLEPNNSALQDRMTRVRELRGAGRPTTPSTIGEELETNPFLRCSSPEIRRAVADAVADVTDPVQVFAEIRRRKDDFR